MTTRRHFISAVPPLEATGLTCENEEALRQFCPLFLTTVLQWLAGLLGPTLSDRDAVVGALMPASMMAPVECPSFSSSAPASDASAMASPVNGEECVMAMDLDDRLSPNPRQDKRGEVRA